MSENKRRFVVPGILIAAGLAGFGLAAASELGLDWGGTFQAGAVVVQADCQTDEIDVAFAEPEFDASVTTRAPWSVDSLTFSSISSACADATYEVAARAGASSGWTIVGTGKVPTGGTLTLDFANGVTATNITELALTMHKATG